MHRKFIFILTFTLCSMALKAITINAALFEYDAEKVEATFAGLDELEHLLEANPDWTIADVAFRLPQYSYMLENVNPAPLGLTGISAPGKIPSFWWAFSFSIVGSYFIYGAVAGPIAVAIVYFNTDKDKAETKKAIYGCLTGTVLGLGIRYLVSNL